MAQMAEFHRGINGRLTRGTLVAVDLVRTAADDKAMISTVVGGDKLTPGQRRTQQAFDAYSPTIGTRAVWTSSGQPNSEALRPLTSWRRSWRRYSRSVAGQRSRPAPKPYRPGVKVTMSSPEMWSQGSERVIPFAS